MTDMSHRRFHKLGACRACGVAVRCDRPHCDGTAIHWCFDCSKIFAEILRAEFPEEDPWHAATCPGCTEKLAARVRQVRVTNAEKK